MPCRKASYWKKTVNNKIESFMKNHSWELMNLFPGSKSYSSLYALEFNPSTYDEINIVVCNSAYHA